MNDERIFVIGVGMNSFVRCETDVEELAQAATPDALSDPGIAARIEQAFCGYVHRRSTSAQQSLYGIGMTGIPVYNVNESCSMASTALNMACTHGQALRRQVDDVGAALQHNHGLSGARIVAMYKRA